jgi:hypothetical protein
MREKIVTKKGTFCNKYLLIGCMYILVEIHKGIII